MSMRSLSLSVFGQVKRFGALALVVACLVAVTSTVISLSVSGESGFVLKPIPESAVHHSMQAPRLRNADGSSSNWSGYAVYPVADTTTAPKHGKKVASPTFSDVKGSWVIPSVAQSDSADTYSSTWIGIDGYTSNTVEQIGTAGDWSGGEAVYYAWFETYPRSAYEIVGFPVNPGDTISGEVQSMPKGAFKMTLTNVTENVTFSTTQRLQSGARLSAEWVQEAPWWGGVLPLADFGTVDFFDCSATMNGHTGPINDTAWQYDSVTMETGDATVKAQPSALSADGSAFSVTWGHE